MSSIKSKIIVSIAVIIIFFGSIATFFVFSMTKKNLIEKDQAHIEQYNAVHNAMLKQALISSKTLVKNIAENDEIVSILENKERLDKVYGFKIIDHITDHYLDAVNLEGKYSAIYIMNKDGEVITSTNRSFIGNNYGFRKYFLTAIKGQAYTDVSIGVTTKKLGYYFSYPVKSQDENIIGVAVVKMKPSILSAPFEHYSFHDMNVMLVDSNGVIVYSKDENKLLHSLDAFSKKELDEFNNEKRYGGITIESIGYSDVQNYIKTLDPKQEEISKLFDSSIDNEYIVLSNIEGFPFYAITEINTHDSVDIAVKTSKLIAVLVLTAAAMATIFISILVSKITKPLSNLQKVVEKVSSGDLSQRVDIETRDEIGLLALSFNKMIDSIIKTRANVDRKVEEQTKSLKAQQIESDRIRKNAEKVAQAMSGRELKMIELKQEIKKLKEEKGAS